VFLKGLSFGALNAFSSCVSSLSLFPYFFFLVHSPPFLPKRQSFPDPAGGQFDPIGRIFDVVWNVRML